MLAKLLKLILQFFSYSRINIRIRIWASQCIEKLSINERIRERKTIRPLNKISVIKEEMDQMTGKAVGFSCNHVEFFIALLSERPAFTLIYLFSDGQVQPIKQRLRTSRERINRSKCPVPLDLDTIRLVDNKDIAYSINSLK